MSILVDTTASCAVPSVSQWFYYTTERVITNPGSWDDPYKEGHGSAVPLLVVTSRRMQLKPAQAANGAPSRRHLTMDATHHRTQADGNNHL